MAILEDQGDPEKMSRLMAAIGTVIKTKFYLGQINHLSLETSHFFRDIFLIVYSCDCFALVWVVHETIQLVPETVPQYFLTIKVIESQILPCFKNQ